MARYRETGLQQKSYTNQRDFNAPPPLGNGAQTVNVDRTYESLSQGTKRTITDVVTPGFKKLRASGAVLMNPVTITQDVRNSTSSSHTFDAAGTAAAIWGKRIVSGDLACAWSNPPSRPSWFATRVSDAMARTLIFSHSKVAKEEFMALVTVAEAGKTASLVARPFGAATDLINRIVTRRSSLMAKGLTLAAATTQAYLELRFGWKPLLHDLEGIFDAWVKATSWQEKPVRIVARSSDKDIHWVSGGVVTTSENEGCKSVMSAEYDHEARVSSGVLYELRDLDFEDATRRHMGLRLADVPSSLWELIPLSFVVDRFVDVGKWLYAIQPKPSVTILGSWTTIVDIQRNFHKVIDTLIDFNPVYPVILSGGKGGTFSEEIRVISRVANPVLPSLPTVNYRDLNLIQQIDHAALITQRLLGLKAGNLRI